jgi:hypothetical protein
MKNKLFISLLFLAASVFADTTTNRMGLTIPTIGSPNWGPKINGDMQIIDAQSGVTSTTNTFVSSNVFTGYTQFASTVNWQNVPHGTGQCLGVNTSSNTVYVACGSSGSGSPGGPNLSLQFNDNGVFSGSSTVTTDGANINASTLTLTGPFTAKNLGWTGATLNITGNEVATGPNIAIQGIDATNGGEQIGVQGKATAASQGVGVDGIASVSGSSSYAYGVRGTCNQNSSSDCAGGHFSTAANGTTNYALWASASGTSSSNYALYSPAGIVLISSNTILPGATFYQNAPTAISSIIWPNGTIQVSSPSASAGSGSGIVSPGTFTWTNQQGLIVSTVTASSVTASGFILANNGLYVGTSTTTPTHEFFPTGQTILNVQQASAGGVTMRSLADVNAWNFDALNNRVTQDTTLWLQQHKDLEFYDSSNNFFVALESTGTGSYNSTYQLPSSTGTVGQVMTIAGVYPTHSDLAWSTPSGGGSSLPLPAGATNYIQNSNTLQSGTTFYVSSGSVSGQFFAGPMQEKSASTAWNYGSGSACSAEVFNNGFGAGKAISCGSANGAIDGQDDGTVGTGGYFSVNGTGGTNYGVQAINTAAFLGQTDYGILATANTNHTGTNYGAFLSASGGSATDYGLWVDQGQVQIQSSMTVAGAASIIGLVTVSSVQASAFNSSASSFSVTGSGGFAIASSSAAQMNLTEGSSTTVFGVIAGADMLWADSGSHTLEFNPNNTSTYTVAGTSVTTTTGHLAVFGTTPGSLIDGGAVGTGSVTSVTGTAPIISSNGTTPAISLSATIGQSETFTGSSVTVAGINGLTVTGATTNPLVTISSTPTGVALVSVSSTPAAAPSDFIYAASSQTGTTTWGVQYDGHMVSSGTTPSMGTCGSSPSVIGTDAAAVITVGSGVVTSCTMNFANPWANPPVCVESDNSTAVTGDITTTTTSSITFGFSATLGGGQVNVICIGQKG